MHFYLKYFLLMILPVTHTPLVVSAQFGDPVYSQTFGEGNNDPNTIGPRLNHGKQILAMRMLYARRRATIQLSGE